MRAASLPFALIATCVFCAAVISPAETASLKEITEPQGYVDPGARGVHDPTIIQHGDSFYVFSTKRLIPIHRSKDLVHWETVGRVFAEMPGWAKREIPQARSLWAPDISFFNGKYHLYYCASIFGQNRSVIGLATNLTLDPADARYRWLDRGKVLESHPGRDDWNAIDANLTLDEQGKPWLAFGSFWGGIQLVAIDPATGKRADADAPLTLAARPREKAVEAPFILRKNGYYYLFVSFDQCCRGSESTYKMMVGRSRALAGPYVDRRGRSLREGGGTPLLAGYGRWRGPGHCDVLAVGAAEFLVHHAYDAEADGERTLQVRRLIWDKDGWPVPAEPYRGEWPKEWRAAEKDVAGKWQYYFGEKNDAFDVECLPDGRLAPGQGAWRLEGSRLFFNWLQRPNVPGAPRAYSGELAPDASCCVGRDQNGQSFRGIRIR